MRLSAPAGTPTARQASRYRGLIPGRRATGTLCIIGLDWVCWRDNELTHPDDSNWLTGTVL